eukprot:TRINITY_DN15763_c0_g1_i1.p1 TRINITY_DN15763_c0_g1~~TRINITY_DN15763_c0_g1_i1.p1  ORF type:complete len:198 (+),score=33.46 TRINITY_DN15763_c0_g1_i1:168-761(+)
MGRFRRLCVFCGSSEGKSPVYVEQAKMLGQELAKRGIELVYGGGSVGVMGALARAVDGAGAKVTGVIPHSLMQRELSGEAIGELVLTKGMHDRKAKMASLADGFIALPGGYGTMEEVLEALTWVQLGIQSKPVGILNTNHYYDALIAMIDTGLREGFIKEKHRDIYCVSDTVTGLLDKMEQHTPPPGLTTWLSPEES